MIANPLTALKGKHGKNFEITVDSASKAQATSAEEEVVVLEYEINDEELTKALNKAAELKGVKKEWNSLENCTTPVIEVAEATGNKALLTAFSPGYYFISTPTGCVGRASAAKIVEKMKKADNCNIF